MSGRVRCPMCEQSNDANAPVCAFCGRVFDHEAEERDLQRRATAVVEESRKVPPKLLVGPSVRVVGIDGLTDAEVADEIARGGRFIVYSWCFSVLILTFRRPSDIHFIRAGQSRIAAGLPYTFLTLVAGWWGFPWGLLWTPLCVIRNFAGGTDVTQQVYPSGEMEPTPEFRAAAA